MQLQTNRLKTNHLATLSLMFLKNFQALQILSKKPQAQSHSYIESYIETTLVI